MAVEFLFQIEFQKEDIKEQVEDFLDSLEPDNFDKNYLLFTPSHVIITPEYEVISCTAIFTLR